METASAAIRLAGEKDFVLGSATVRPALSSVVAAGSDVRLQPRVMQVLVALARAEGRVVSRDELVAQCWGGVSVGEDALNRCIQRLRRLSAELPGAFQIVTVPRVGYQLQRAEERTGAWVAETEPAPWRELQTSSPLSDTDRTRPPIRTRAWLVALIVALGFGAVAVLASRRSDSGAASGREISIVVAPLQTSVGDAPARVVQAGLSSDLARAMLANPLQISVSTVGATDATPSRRILLDGDAFSLGPRLNVHLTLRDTATREILWSSAFSGYAAQADALRERAALKVGAVLNCALHSRQSEEVTNAAVRLYLSACDDIGDSKPSAALDRLRRLTALAPHFAQAWAELAATIATTADDLPSLQQRAAEREAVADAQRALALDPHTGLAYFALALAAPGPANWTRRAALIETGLKVEPEAAELDDLLGEALQEVGRSTEAVAAFQRAVDLDPLSPVKTADLIAALADAGRYDDAEDAITKARRIWPNDRRVWSRAFTVEARLGDPARAQRLVDDPSRPTLRDPVELAYWRAWLRFRETPDARNRQAVLVRMRESARSAGHDEALVQTYQLAELGLIDAAYAAASPAARMLTEAADHLLFRPELAGFRADPRFMTLAVRLGLVAIWRASGRWPDFCTASSAPYDCVAVAARGPG